jgi:hypothetical protein
MDALAFRDPMHRCAIRSSASELAFSLGITSANANIQGITAPFRYRTKVRLSEYG